MKQGPFVQDRSRTLVAGAWLARLVLATLLVSQSAYGLPLNQPLNVAVSPDGGFVYVGTLRGLIVYTRDSGTGLLTFWRSFTSDDPADPTDDRCPSPLLPLSPRAMVNTRGIVATSDGYVYAAGVDQGLILIFHHEAGDLKFKGKVNVGSIYYLAASKSPSFGELIYATLRVAPPVPTPAPGDTEAGGVAVFKKQPDGTLVKTDEKHGNLFGCEHPAVTDQGDFIYVPGTNAGTLRALQRDSGLPDQLAEFDTKFDGPGLGASLPYWVDLWPTNLGTFAYLASEGSGAVTVFTRDSGHLNVLDTKSGITGAGVVVATENFVYAGTRGATNSVVVIERHADGTFGDVKQTLQVIDGGVDRLKGLFAMAKDPGAQNLYVAAPGDTMLPANGDVAVFKIEADGSLTVKQTVTDDGAPYGACTPTSTPTSTSTPTVTPTFTPTVTQTPHDSVVLPFKPKTYEIPVVPKKRRILFKVRNADVPEVAGHPVQISVTPDSACPAGLVTGVDFLPMSSTDTVVVPGKVSKKVATAKLHLLTPVSVSSPNGPVRCRLALAAQTNPPSGGDRSPANNLATVEIDFVDKATVKTPVPNQSYIAPIGAVKINLSGSANANVPFVLHNLTLAPMTLAMSVDSFSCPVAGSPFTFTWAPGASITVPVGKKTGHLKVSASKPAFSGAKALAPIRCTVVVKAAGVAGDDATNNTTQLTVDVYP